MPAVDFGQLTHGRSAEADAAKIFTDHDGWHAHPCLFAPQGTVFVISFVAREVGAKPTQDFALGEAPVHCIGKRVDLIPYFRSRHSSRSGKVQAVLRDD